METNDNCIRELCLAEQKEISGGLMLIIRIFVPTVNGIIGFFEGLKEGYDRGTATP
jgi:hypothetical protein